MPKPRSNAPQPGTMPGPPRGHSRTAGGCPESRGEVWGALQDLPDTCEGQQVRENSPQTPQTSLMPQALRHGTRDGCRWSGW